MTAKSKSSWSQVGRYAAALLAVAIAVVARLGLSTWLGPDLPTFILFYPAVMLAALLGGLGPGLLATAASAVAADYYVISPAGFGIHRAVDLVGVLLFLGMGTMFSVVAEYYRRSLVDLATHKRAEEQLQQLNRVLWALKNSSGAMLRAVSEKQYLDEVCDIVVKTCGHPLVWVGFAENDENKTIRAVASAGFDDAYLESLKLTWADSERGRGPTGTAIRTGQPRGCPDVITDPSFAPWRAEALRRGYASSLAVPLLAQGKAFGAITVYARKPQAFSPEETQLMFQLAEDVAYCLSSLRLRAAKAEAEEQLRLVSAAVEAAANGVAVADRSGRLVWVNPAFTRLTGFGEAEATGQIPRVLKAGQHPPEYYAQMWETILRGECWRGEVSSKRQDGSLYAEEMTITPLCGAGGEMTHFVAIKQDITERKRAEVELARTAAELARSNQDLEQFAYVASHDLQEPLRAVGGFVKLLQRRFPEKVDSKALEYISGAVEGAMRMERLITDLLAYSRVGTAGKEFAMCDLNAAFKSAVLNLRAGIQAAHARVTADALPKVLADGTQMTQLLQNLIGNALKFRGEAAPEIHVSAARQDARWVIQVRDNGIGIEPQYFERIFQIFQRLHTRRHYPGTGIGLAICKKIVERHGGRIWVESEPGRGSKFYFTLSVTPS